MSITFVFTIRKNSIVYPRIFSIKVIQILSFSQIDIFMCTTFPEISGQNTPKPSPKKFKSSPNSKEMASGFAAFENAILLKLK